MTRSTSLLIFALAFGFLAASPSLAETPTVSADSQMELWSASIVNFAPQEEPLFTPAELLMVTNFFGHEVFMPTTSIRACEPGEEIELCGVGCTCLFINNIVRCFC